MKRAEQIFAAALLIFSIYMVYECTLIDRGAGAGDSGIGADFMPFWLSVGLAVAAAALLGRALLWPDDRFAAGFFADRTGRRRVLWVFAGFFAAVAALKPLGILFSLAILMATTMPAFGARSWKAILATAVLTPAAVFVVFGLWLKVDLPMGVLENVLSIY